MNRILFERKALRAAMLVLMLNVIGMMKGYAYDFSAVCSTGQTLYYTILNPTTHVVSIVRPGSDSDPWGNYTKPTGFFEMPATVVYNDVSYTIISIGKYAFYGCNGLTGSLTIPSSVTSIEKYAFYGCSGLNGTLTIPNSVLSISQYAFYGCSGLTGSVTIPSTQSSIPPYAFYGCSGLTGPLTIPSSVSSIGQAAFYGCSGLNGALTIPSTVTTIQRYAFWGCSGFTGSLTIPNSVTIIGSSTFRGCSGFTGSLTISSSVTSIGDYAFYNCSGFTGSLTISSSVTSIGDYAFYNCSGFTGSLTIGNSVTTIGNSAFFNCSGFTGSLTIGNSVTTIGDYAFYNCSGFTGSLTIGNSVATIGYAAFEGCSGFTGSLAIPNSVTTIGNSAFFNCSGFTGSLTIGNSVTTIGYAAFEGCSGFTGSLAIPNLVTTIGASAFEGCSGFTGSLAIPNSVTTIGVSAFEGCSGFTGSLTIGNSVTTIGNYAFKGCSGFTGMLTIGNSVTTIGNYAFKGCSGFTGSLTIGNSVTTIGDYAFEGCSGFTGSLAIPDSVTTIGNYAFKGCSGFTGMLAIGNSVTTIGDYAFEGCSGFTGSLAIPDSVMTIGSYAFNGCSGFSGSLTIGNSVTIIGYYAFYGCSGFTGTLTIGNSVTTIGNYAFKGCSGFTGMLAIGNSVTTIGDYAFEGCSGFTGSLAIPDSVTTIGSYAFNGCSGFSGSLTIGNSVTIIGNYAFYGCSGFTGTLTIGNSVATIRYSAFSGCSGFSGINWNAINATDLSTFLSSPFYGWTNLSTVVFGDQVQTIPSYIFSGCDGLTGSLTIPNSVTTIGNYAFEGCSGFTGSLAIPDSVTTIGNYAFKGCSGFTGSLTIGNSVTTIGNYAFEGCSGFTGSLTIGNSVTTIGNSAFEGCSGFTGSLTIGYSVTTIGSSAFYGCSNLNFVHYTGNIAQWCYISFDGYASNPLNYAHNLYIGNELVTNLVIPETVTEIKQYVFCGYSSLKSVTISNSVANVDREAFTGCSGLEAVYYTGDIAQWCAIQFGNSSSNPLGYAHHLYVDDELVTDLVIPASVTQINNFAFYSCSGLETLTIPNSVTMIGNYAFYECSGLTGTLNIPNSVTIIGGNAFEYCSGFTCLTIGDSEISIGPDSFGRCTGLNAIRVHCPTPPSLHKWSFYQVDRSIPVFVPCNTQDDYKAAQYWSEFENINESPYNLVITSNDKQGGEISVLQWANCEDNHCAILAVPNIGYNFLGWYVDDYFATITPFCDFSLTEDVTFEARFEMLPNHNVANGTSNLWSDPGTWFLGEVPDATSTVGIRKNVIVDVDADVSAVGIYGNSTLTVLPGVTLTVTDTLGSTKNSSIIIQDGGQLVHSSDSAAATIQKSIEPYTSDDDGWNLISFPLVGNGDLTTVDNMLSNQYDLYAYDEPSSVWKNQKNESNDFTTLEAGVGYLYANRGVGVGDVAGSKVGNGTSTIGNSPFQTYWNYSIAENLFFASELEGAGLTTAPLGALCWYATNTTGYQQSNISIWMANVSDAELTETSHDVSGMTLVYTGSMIPLVGWNTFAFNENSFTWDGTSNVLVCVQRNNGVYNSTIYWQAHDPGFAATSYKYNDGSAYDMTTETYSVTVSSSLRPNTIFQTIGQVGQYESYLPITMSFAGEIENGAAEVTVPLSYTEGVSLAGFNLVGNPFVHNVTSYTGINVADGCYRMNETRDNLIVSEISTSNPLKPAEGFFVKATGEGASVTFNQQTRGLAEKSGYINLELSSNGKLIDRLMVRDRVEPLEKLSLGHSKARLFVVKDHQEMAIVPMEGNEQPIYFKTAKNGTYTITVNLEGMELNYLHLIDHKTGANVNLLAEPSYSFEARNSDYESRFQLVYSLEGGNGSDDEPFAFISNGQIIVDGTGTLLIFDVTGRMISSQNASNNIPINGMSAGVYMLHLVNNDNVKIQKIVIK